MTTQDATDIMARVLRMRGVAGRLSSLLHEREWKGGLGETATVGEIDRTIEDLAGHWHEGRFVGAKLIAQASAITARNARAAR